MRAVIRAALVCALLLAGSLSARATPTEELGRARESFLAGQYEQAIPQLTSLLYPTSRLADAALVAEAHLLLGVSYFETGQLESAEREFEEALFLDASITVDESLFSEESVRFFTKTQAEIERKRADAEDKARLARERDRLRRALENLVVLEKRRYYVNFIPFGAGQFQNGEKRKGALFFIGEAVTGGTSVALWSYQLIRYGSGGVVPGREVPTVRRIQVVQIASGAAFFGLMAWGIIDSLANYEHTIQRTADPSVLQDLDLDDEAAPPSALRLTPSIGPDSAGLSLSWEF